MKICPACQTTYKDDTLRFCMKDGTSLNDFQEPTAVAAEPEVDDEQTIFAAKQSPKMVVPLNQPEPTAEAPPTSSAPVNQQTAAPVNQQTAAPQPQKRKTSAGILIALGAFVVLALLGIGVLGAYLLFGSRSSREVAVSNSNSGSNQNANVTIDANVFANFNSNTNANANLNLNANLKSPTPTPTRTPTPTPTPANRNANASNSNLNNANVGNANANPATNANVARPTPPPTVVTPTPPRPTTPSTVSGGVVNGKAINLPKPAYPQAARALRASGAVNVQVLIDESGRVVSAQAVSGHPLLRGAAESAARQARFQPTVLSGQPVKVSGTIVYNFNIN